MRLVSVAHAYPRWDGDVAGAFIERLCVALNDRSHSVVVVVPADEGKGGRIVRNNLDVRRVRYAPASRETLAYRGHMADAGKSLLGLLPVASMIASQAGAVFEEVRASRADLVHAHWWVPGGVSAWLACIAAETRAPGAQEGIRCHCGFELPREGGRKGLRLGFPRHHCSTDAARCGSLRSAEQGW